MLIQKDALRLLKAIRNDNIEIVKILLKLGANINQVNSKGETS
ncbi:hypothetical protein [Tenacibaculum sediminilitoris]